MKAYLSGGMEFSDDQGAGWRESIEQWLLDELGHLSFNPVRESALYAAEKFPGIAPRQIRQLDPERYRSFVHGIVQKDTEAIALHADYVICLWDEGARRGAGTQGEVTLAKYLGKPVYIVTKSSASEIPGWITGCATEFFDSFDALKLFLRATYRNGEMPR